MTLVSVTRLRLRSVLFLPAFTWDARRAIRQVALARGFRGGQVLAQRGRVFWTLTVWEDEAAMRAYRNSGPHRAAMPRLAAWCDEAAVLHWTREGDAVPAWAEVHRRMADARLTPLPRPSPAHVARDFGSPLPSSADRASLPLYPRHAPDAEVVGQPE